MSDPFDSLLDRQRRELGRLNALLTKERAKLEAAQKANAKDRHMRDALYWALNEMVAVTYGSSYAPLCAARDRAQVVLLSFAGPVDTQEPSGLAERAAK